MVELGEVGWRLGGTVEWEPFVGGAGTGLAPQTDLAVEGTIGEEDLNAVFCVVDYNPAPNRILPFCDGARVRLLHSGIISGRCITHHFAEPMISHRHPS